jgi:hypothetical protein
MNAWDQIIGPSNIIKIMRLFFQICTRSEEDGGNVTFIWKKIKIVDSRENETIRS